MGNSDHQVKDIGSFITTEESAYTLPIPVGVDAYEWSMRDTISTAVLYKVSKFTKGNDANRPFRNIIRPILNLQYRAEGFDVKDIVLYVNDPSNYFKSFLVKKFHEKWARDNAMDTFIDEMVETYVDFGGVLIQKTKDPIPRVVKLESLAFCDQSNITGGPIGIKHFMGPDELRDMESKGWGDTAHGADMTIEELIIVSRNEKTTGKYDSNKVKTPGKYLEVYEVHGTLPESFLKDDGGIDKYVPQMQIVTFYVDGTGEKQWVTLFKGEEKEFKFKFLKRGRDFGRALGFGGAEELFQPQVWTNWNEIIKKDMLEAASKVVHVTDDDKFPTRNKITDLDNGEILNIAEGRTIKQLDVRPVNLDIYDRATQAWEANAQQMGAANDAIQGKTPPSGTPFALQELVTAESHSLHEYRKGQISTFLDEIYRDWTIPHITKEIMKDQEFLADLELDELQAVAESLVKIKVEDFKKEKILNGEVDFNEADVEIFREKAREEFMQGGSKRFIQIFNEEFKDTPIDVITNIAGKQKDLALRTEKLVRVFNQLFSTFDPQTKTFVALDDPRIAKLFNEILENSDLSPIDFSQRPQRRPAVDRPAAAPVATQGDELSKINV